MKRIQIAVCVALPAFLSLPTPGYSQPFGDTVALLAAQREAMAKLQGMNGVLRGTATVTLPSGEKRGITQTERIGPFLDGSLK